MATIVGAKITNIKAIEKALLEAFEQWTEEDVNKKHWKYQFIERRWDYTGETVRRNPDAFIRIAGESRDIYDFGALYDSGVKSYKFASDSDGADASWHWDATNSSGKEYASAVHNGTKFMDGRPFTDDISLPSSFFLKTPGKDLVARVQTALNSISL